MASPEATIVDVGGNFKTKMFTYAMTTADHTSVAFEWCNYADRSVTLIGTWGGATAVIEGSNDGSNFIALADPQGGAISKPGDSIEAILELTRYVRVRLSTVGAGATITVSFLCRKN